MRVVISFVRGRSASVYHTCLLTFGKLQSGWIFGPRLTVAARVLVHGSSVRPIWVATVNKSLCLKRAMILCQSDLAWDCRVAVFERRLHLGVAGAWYSACNGAQGEAPGTMRLEVKF